MDPLLWRDGPIASTYPACMAVKAAAEQADDGGYRYLRALREGLFCLRRKLDTTEALVEEARGAGLDVERFRIDLASNAIVEAFGNDLEATRAVPEEARAAGAVETGGGVRHMPFPRSRSVVAALGVRAQACAAWQRGGLSPTDERPLGGATPGASGGWPAWRRRRCVACRRRVPTSSCGPWRRSGGRDRIADHWPLSPGGGSSLSTADEKRSNAARARRPPATRSTTPRSPPGQRSAG